LDLDKHFPWASQRSIGSEKLALQQRPRQQPVNAEIVRSWHNLAGVAPSTEWLEVGSQLRTQADQADALIAPINALPDSHERCSAVFHLGGRALRACVGIVEEGDSRRFLHALVNLPAEAGTTLQSMLDVIHLIALAIEPSEPALQVANCAGDRINWHIFWPFDWHALPTAEAFSYARPLDPAPASVLGTGGRVSLPTSRIFCNRLQALHREEWTHAFLKNVALFQLAFSCLDSGAPRDSLGQVQAHQEGRTARAVREVMSLVVARGDTECGCPAGAARPRRRFQEACIWPLSTRTLLCRFTFLCPACNAPSEAHGLFPMLEAPLSVCGAWLHEFV